MLGSRLRPWPHNAIRLVCRGLIPIAHPRLLHTSGLFRGLQSHSRAPFCRFQLRCYHQTTPTLTTPPPTPDDERVDPRARPIVLSSLLTGTAIGVILPLLPLFAITLGVGTAQLGLLVGALGFARLAVNLPAAWLAERYGRRPLLLAGPLLTSLGLGLTGAASNFTELVGTRLMVGAGGAFQIAGAQLYLSDISTAANRARTLVPNMVAFSVGGLVGPAIGGYLAEAFGLVAPFYFVAAALVLVTLNNTRLPETHHELTPMAKGTIAEAFRHTLGQWAPLVKSRDLQAIMALHGIFWFVISGAQSTLLPLLATQQLGLGPSAVGMCFATMAAINITFAQPVAWMSDKWGRKPLMVLAIPPITCALVLLPLAPSYEAFMALIVLWGAGSTLLSGGPVSYVADLVPPNQRAPALALLRCAGDLGLMMGGTLVGCFASCASVTAAFGASALLLAASGAAFAAIATDIRRHLPPQPPPPTMPLSQQPGDLSTPPTQPPA